MGHLQGLKEYLHEAYGQSIFEQALTSHTPWALHLHGRRVVQARVVEIPTYDVKLDIEGQGVETVPKIQIKFLYPVELSAAVMPLIKMDKKVQVLDLQPILRPTDRYFVKNKSLFPLKQERQVVFFTLLEGEVLRGIVDSFSRYDITVNLKGGVPIVILRHSIYDVRNKQGRCFLKSFQDQHRDWEKSTLFVS